MVKSLVDLKGLKISYISRLEDRVLNEIAGMCKSLLEINLSWCQLITDEGLIQLAMSLNRLKRIELRSCANLGRLYRGK